MKLGPHILPGGGDGIRLVQAGAQVCKLVDDFGLAAQIKSDHPACLVIGRIVEADASLDPVNDYSRGISPETAAAWFVGRQENKYRLNPDIETWEGPNETALSHGPNDDLPLAECILRMTWYASFEIWRLILLADMGLRGVIGNFSTGTPDLRLWAAFTPALLSAKAHNGRLGLHEYMGAKPDFGVGDNPLRYRTVPEIKASGVQVVIDEFAFDRVQGPPGYVTGAWRDLADQWIAHGDTTDPERYCADAYIWYGEELRKDPYVIGAAIFTSGNAGNDIWKRHDIVGSRIPDYLVEYGENLPPDPPAEGDDMAALSDALENLKKATPVGVVKTLTGLTLRDANGASLGILPAGSVKLVYQKDVDYPWLYGDNRVHTVPDGTVPLENIWGGDSGSVTLEWL